MLPKNRLRRQRMQRLRIFRDDVHPHADAVAPPAHLKFEPRVDRHDSKRRQLVVVIDTDALFL